MTRLDLLQIDLTDECPLFCSHCSNSSGPQLESALRYSVVEEAVLDAAHLGCQDITLSGGEPLRYADLSRILALCRKLGMNSTIFTTGVRDKNTRLPLRGSEWEELKTLGLNTAVFSVYSGPANREFHNRIVRLRPLGMQDAFEVNELGILRARNAGIVVELQFVPSDETCHELPAIAVWAAKLGASRLHIQYPTDQGRNQHSATLVVSAGPETILRENAFALSSGSDIRIHISRLWCSKWGIESETPQRTQIIVRSDGAVSLCNACKYIVEQVRHPNIYRQALRHIWKDEKWRNAPCECATHSNRQSGQSSVAPGSSDMHTVRANDLLTSRVE